MKKSIKISLIAIVGLCFAFAALFLLTMNSPRVSTAWARMAEGRAQAKQPAQIDTVWPVSMKARRAEILDWDDKVLARSVSVFDEKTGDSVQVREYPYGNLARRTIGFVRSGDFPESARYVGIEGKYDYLLGGEDGYQVVKSRWVKWPFRPAKFVRKVKETVPAKDGEYMNISLNIDMQAKADSALRAAIDDNPEIQGGCLVVSDVKGGWIRAMVNFVRYGDDGDLGEYYNVAIAHCYEPGSILAPATAITAMRCGGISSLDDKLPTNHGRSGYSKIMDPHIREYEFSHGTDSISVRDGILRSSRYVMAALAEKFFYQDEQMYVDTLKQVFWGDGYGSLFWEIEGLGDVTIPDPSNKSWSVSSIGSLGCGYGISAPALYYLGLYNAIARGGTGIYHRMVGEIVRDNRFLNKEHIWCPLEYYLCTKEQADEMTEALVESAALYPGMSEAKRTVAGKVGTSYEVMPNGWYSDDDGKRVMQQSFAGFFPAENPEYSVVCMVYTKPTVAINPASGIPARAVANLVNAVYE